MEWLWQTLIGFAIEAVPAWMWVVLAGAGIGWAWRVLGWQGILGGVAAILTLGAYRQGWRDARAGRTLVLPEVTQPKAKPRRRAKTLVELFARKS